MSEAFVPGKAAAILTIEAGIPGGVPTVVEITYRALERWGYQPTVYRSQFAEGDLSPWERIRTAARDRKPRLIDERGLDTMIVPAPPVPFWGFYAVPQFTIGKLLGVYRGVFVVSGSANVALPLALRSKPYALWLATTYRDELEAKAAVGDQWAQSVLSKPSWRLIEWQEKLAIRRAKRVLSMSYHTAERIRELVPEAAGRVETVPVPVDTTIYRPDPDTRRESPYGEYLLLAARINDPRKNVGMLIRAFAIIHERHPQIKLVLAGEAPDEPLRSLVNSLGIGRSVVFAGMVSREELLKLYQGATLFVLPSTQEGLGIVVLEALACGTPVIATRCGGPEGFVIDGETGKLVDDPHDAEAFAEAVLNVLPSAGQMRERCAAFAEAVYSYPVVEARLRQAFETIQPQR
ncbi:MAG: glycosyltransferase family 4 protein [Anaerolineae bacterium]|nr:glycosyltransferase family 4 protein [Anaerolineae bacterium]